MTQLVKEMNCADEAEAFEQRIDSLDRVLAHPTHCVIDTSVLKFTSENYIGNNRNIDSEFSLSKLEQEGCYRFIEFFEGKDVIFPQEVIDEFYDATVGLRRYARSMSKIRVFSGRMIDEERGGGTSKIRVDDLHLLSDAIRDTVRARQMLKRFLHHHRTEDIIPPRTKKYLWFIERACEEVSRQPGVLVDKLKVYGREGLAKNRYNDARILAKTIALLRPAAIVTGDGDYVDLARAVWRQRGELSVRWLRRVYDSHPIDVAYMHPGGVDIYHPGGERISIV